jgi:hypothetical protein
MPLEKRQVKDQLLNKFGFEPVEGSQYDRIAFFYNGMKIVSTHFSRGAGKDLVDDLLTIMAKEILVYKLGFFKGMIICTKSKDDYINLLKQANYIQE